MYGFTVTWWIRFWIRYLGLWFRFMLRFSQLNGLWRCVKVLILNKSSLQSKLNVIRLKKPYYTIIGVFILKQSHVLSNRSHGTVFRFPN